MCECIATLTLHLTSFLATLMVASQKAPLYLALTSVPMFKNGGSSEDCEGVRGVSSGGGVWGGRGG